jgi:hypothetical protein
MFRGRLVLLTASASIKDLRCDSGVVQSFEIWRSLKASFRGGEASMGLVHLDIAFSEVRFPRKGASPPLDLPHCSEESVRDDTMSRGLEGLSTILTMEEMSS